MTSHPSTDEQPLDGLDACGTLMAAQEALRRRRSAEVSELELVAHWADLHATDPALDPEWFAADGTPLPRPPGAERLVRLGGDGTPSVRDLALAELAVAREERLQSTRAAVADVLDLRHRLPRVWRAVLDLRLEPWVARKVAVLARVLDAARCPLVDRAVAAAVGHAPGKLLALAQAVVVEADPEGHAGRVDAERLRRYATLTRTDEAGMRTLVARLDAGDACAVGATITRVSEILALLARDEHERSGAPVPCRDRLRAEAVTWLARPAELLALLLEHADDPVEPDLPAEPDPCAEPEAPEPGLLAFPAALLDALRAHDLRSLRPRAVLFLHLHQHALERSAGVARVEGLGPVALDQLHELLGHHQVSVRPVLDLAEQVSTAAYEFPATIRERLHLLHDGDAFPHAATRPTPASGRLDHDHVVPHDATGPPGQTSVANGQPLTRSSHRAKTHLAYTCDPLGPGRVRWRTPHGLTRVVDHRGTHAAHDPSPGERRWRRLLDDAA